MQHWRQTFLLKLTRWLVLLVVLGQSTLLLHESLHGIDPGVTECHLCLHAQPQLSVNQIIPVPVFSFEHVAVLSPCVTRPNEFSPVYSNSSRGPPRT